MGHRDGQHGKVSLWQDQTVQADCFLTVWRCENQHGGVGVSWDRDPGCVPYHPGCRFGPLWFYLIRQNIRQKVFRHSFEFELGWYLAIFLSVKLR